MIKGVSISAAINRLIRAEEEKKKALSLLWTNGCGAKKVEDWKRKLLFLRFEQSYVIKKDILFKISKPGFG